MTAVLAGMHSQEGIRARQHFRSLWLAGLVLVACGGDAMPSGDVQVDTLTTGRIVISNPAFEVHPMVQEWRLEKEVELGSLDGDHDAFGRVIALELGDSGEILVADIQSQVISVFDERGRFSHAIGESGEGPGEFRMLSGIRMSPDGLIWAMDPLQSRLSAFTAEGEFVGTHPHFEGAMGASIPWGGRFDHEGFLYDVTPGSRAEEGREVVRIAIGPDEVELSAHLSLPAHPTPSYSRAVSIGVMESAVPFTQRQHWTVTSDGAVWFSGHNGARVHRLGPEGDTALTTEIQAQPRQISGSTRDSVQQVTGLNDREVPRDYPVITGLNADAQNNILVSVDAEAESGGTSWYFISPSGFLVAKIRSIQRECSDDIAPVFAGSWVACVSTDELGLQTVGRYRIVQDGRRAGARAAPFR